MCVACNAYPFHLLLPNAHASFNMQGAPLNRVMYGDVSDWASRYLELVLPDPDGFVAKPSIRGNELQHAVTALLYLIYWNIEHDEVPVNTAKGKIYAQ